MKICSKCQIEKSLDEFGVRKKASKDGRKSACKECISKQDKESYYKNIDKERQRGRDKYQDNQEKYLNKTKEYYHNNKEKRQLYLDNKRKEQPQIFLKYKKQFQSINPEYHKKYMFNRRKEDPLFKLITNLRSRTYSFLKNGRWSKNKKFTEYIGCNLYELMDHLQNKFLENMSWDNYGQWHVDHIIPLASAKTEKEVYTLFHYTNLQPLWALDNFKKSDKL